MNEKEANRADGIKDELKHIRKEIKKLTDKLKPFKESEKALCVEFAILKYGIKPKDKVIVRGSWHHGKTGIVLSVEPCGLYRPSYTIQFEGDPRPQNAVSYVEKI